MADFSHGNLCRESNRQIMTNHLLVFPRLRLDIFFLLVILQNHFAAAEPSDGWLARMFVSRGLFWGSLGVTGWNTMRFKIASLCFHRLVKQDPILRAFFKAEGD